MSLGNGGNNNFTTNSSADNNKRDNSPQVYCPILFKNPDAPSDPSELGFAYWKNLLKISISPKLDFKEGDKYVQYDHTNNAAIYINAMKAKIFAKEIREMLANPGQLNSVSVPSGSTGLITFSNGVEYGLDNYVLVIRKLDENGKVNTSYSYNFQGKNYYTAIRNFDEVTLSYDKKYYELLEIEWFIELLEEFSKAQNYAVAYTVVDAMKYDVTRLTNRVESIMEKLGIQNSYKSNSRQNSGKSFFDTSNNAAKQSQTTDAGYGSVSNTTTLDAIANELE